MRDLPLIGALDRLFSGQFGSFLTELVRDAVRLWPLLGWLFLSAVAGWLGVAPTDRSVWLAFWLIAPHAYMGLCVWVGLYTPMSHRTALFYGLVGYTYFQFAPWRTPADYGLTSLAFDNPAVWALCASNAVASLASTLALVMIFLNSPYAQLQMFVRRTFGLREFDGGARWATNGEMARRFNAPGGFVLGKEGR